uniref:uncharacterized GPI-anchored protein At3g06035-like n=1 Tax=Erigeron canadensis TaxID=72917 RepID=UPI001CB9D2BC|nr:uncharacterized GPI-anchored protein At3g06035-like [Erigeron canadensis]
MEEKLKPRMFTTYSPKVGLLKMFSPRLICIYASLLVYAFLLLPTPGFSDEEDNLLQGINSFRQSRNLAALTKNDNANCVADEIAEALEHKACSSMAGPSIITSTQPRYADYSEIVKKCDIDINTTADGVILPVCVPKRVPTLVLTNYTQSSYASYLNNSRYSEVGIGKEEDWVVMVLTANTPAGTFSNMVAPRLSSVVHVSWALAVSIVIWFGIW